MLTCAHDVSCAEGEATTINDSALQKLDKALDGVITEFIIAAEFTAKAVSVRFPCCHRQPCCSAFNMLLHFAIHLKIFALAAKLGCGKGRRGMGPGNIFWLHFT